MCKHCEKAQKQLQDVVLPSPEAQSQLLDGVTSTQTRDNEKGEQDRDRRVRASILTGLRGSGKTTFLNYALTSMGHDQKIGVLQSDSGGVAVVDTLTPMKPTNAEVAVMPHGCLGLSPINDMVEALRGLALRSEMPLDGLIIECSVLSEVLSVKRAFSADPFVQAAFRLDEVVCVCDAEGFETGSEVTRLVCEQLAVSDVCLLNKCDLVSAPQRDRIRERIRALKPSIRVVPCRHAKVSLKQVLKASAK
jgi:G3E family GTPase